MSGLSPPPVRLGGGGSRFLASSFSWASLMALTLASTSAGGIALLELRPPRRVSCIRIE